MWHEHTVVKQCLQKIMPVVEAYKSIKQIAHENKNNETICKRDLLGV